METLRLGSGRSVPAGAAHGAASPLLAPRPFKLPGLPPSPPTHGKPLSQLSLRPLHPSIPRVGRMRLQLAPRRQSSPNYQCKSDPLFQACFYLYPSLKKHEGKKKWALPKSSKGCFGILSALFQVIPIRGCALKPANSVLHGRKRSMSLAWTFQRAAPTPLAAIALVFLVMLDNIDMRSRQLQSETRPTLCPESGPDQATAAASTPGRHAWLSHPGFQQLHDHPLPPLVRVRVAVHGRVCERDSVCGGRCDRGALQTAFMAYRLFIYRGYCSCTGAGFKNGTLHDDLASFFSRGLTPFTLQRRDTHTNAHTNAALLFVSFADIAALQLLILHSSCCV